MTAESQLLNDVMTLGENGSSSSDYIWTNALYFVLLLIFIFVSCLAFQAMVCCISRVRARNDNRGTLRDAQAGRQLELVAPVVAYHSGLELGGGGKDCAICLDEFADGDEIRLLTRCRHGFHHRCIERWLFSNVSCPICRCNCLVESSQRTGTCIR